MVQFAQPHWLEILFSAGFAFPLFKASYDFLPKEEFLDILWQLTPLPETGGKWDLRKWQCRPKNLSLFIQTLTGGAKHVGRGRLTGTWPHHLLAPPPTVWGRGRRPVSAPPLKPRARGRKWRKPKAISGGPKLGRNLELPRRSCQGLCSSCAPWPGSAELSGSLAMGQPRPSAVWGAGPPAGSPIGRGRASGRRRSSCGHGRCRPGSRHHEHRRGVSHPAQLPLEQVAGQREAGTAGIWGRGPALPSPAHLAHGAGAAPRGWLPPFPRRGLGAIVPQVRGSEGTAVWGQGGKMGRLVNGMDSLGTFACSLV